MKRQTLYYIKILNDSLSSESASISCKRNSVWLQAKETLGTVKEYSLMFSSYCNG